jgi:integrase
MTTVRQHLFAVALERDLRASTVRSYETLLGRLDLLDRDVATVTKDEVLAMLWERIDNPNTRRSTVVALRSTFGWTIKIPKAVPRRYVLPSEDELRLALMMSPFELRGLLMLYCGLRVGEACAVTEADLQGGVLRVDKQVQQLHRTGQLTVTKIGPVKATEESVTIPAWLAPMVATIGHTDKPDSVRESFRRAGKKVGIDLNPHLLRHACATFLLERGAPIMVVSKHLRHSGPEVTLRTYAQHDTGAHIHRIFG